MRISDIICEAIPTSSRGDLYHSTTLNRAFNILRSRVIRPSKDGWVSLSRDSRLRHAQYHHDDLEFHDRRSGPPVYVEFVIDQDRLSRTHHIEPYNWGYGHAEPDSDPRSESEERVRGSIPLRAISGIQIPRDQRDLHRVKLILAQARTLGLKIHLS